MRTLYIYFFGKPQVSFDEEMQAMITNCIFLQNQAS